MNIGTIIGIILAGIGVLLTTIATIRYNDTDDNKLLFIGYYTILFAWVWLMFAML